MSKLKQHNFMVSSSKALATATTASSTTYQRAEPAIHPTEQSNRELTKSPPLTQEISSGQPTKAQNT